MKNQSMSVLFTVFLLSLFMFSACSSTDAPDSTPAASSATAPATPEVKKAESMPTDKKAASAAPDEFHEGFEYFRLPKQQETNAAKGTIEVVELFWYGCGHCYRFEPTLAKWLEAKPKNITFVRIPAQFPNFPGHKFHAKAYYTAVVLKVVHKVHKPLFDAMHISRNPLDSKDKVKAVFVANGVSAGDFDRVFDSEEVIKMMVRDKKISDGYQASGVPLMVINGKFKAGASLVEGSFSKLLVLVEFLVKKESSGK